MHERKYNLNIKKNGPGVNKNYHNTTDIEMEGRQSLQKLKNEIAQVRKTLNEEISWRNMREQDEQELRERKQL